MTKDASELITLKKVDAQHSDFVTLVKDLDAYLTITDGDEHDFYDQYNQLDNIQYVVLAYQNQTAIACGAIKEFDSEAMEVKRMFTKLVYRGKGIAAKVLTELENWAKDLGYKKCILETGKRQIEAVQFYHKQGYQVMTNYGQYQGIENSICFEKSL